MHVGLLALLYLAGLFVMGAGLLLLRDRISGAIWRLRNMPEKIEAQRQLVEERLSEPDWQFYEEHLQRGVPSVLRRVFSREEYLAGAYIFSDLYIHFSPIDQTALTENWVMPGTVPFAECNGDPIFLKPGASESDAVFIAFHDGGDIEELSPTVDSFVEHLRPAAA
jgi:hypothetical protein